MAYKIFIDTNVFLDAFLQRTPDWRDADTILRLATKFEIEIYTSPASLINVMYFLKKQSLTQAQVIKLLELTLSYTILADTSQIAFAQALKAGFNDLEDAVQYFTALNVSGINYFITSNTKDFKKSIAALPVLTPKQFVSVFIKRSKL